MKRQIVAVVLLVAAGVSAVSSAHLTIIKRWRSPAIYSAERHVKILKPQIAALTRQLQDYHAVHGRYPTSDEGLAALDNYKARFQVAVREADPTDLHGLCRVISAEQFWQFGGPSVQAYQEQNGHVPHNAEEFAKTLVGDIFVPVPQGPHRLAVLELGIGAAGDVFILGPAGPLSPWLYPYVYENRNGAAPGAFADSPANTERIAGTVARPAPGIVAYSMTGLDRANWLVRTRRADRLSYVAGVALMILALLLTAAFVIVQRNIAGKLVGVAAVIITYGMLKPSYETCYRMSPGISYRDPTTLRTQRELLDKYRQRGIISQNTFDRMATALDDPLARAGKDEEQEQ